MVIVARVVDTLSESTLPSVAEPGRFAWNFFASGPAALAKSSTDTTAVLGSHGQRFHHSPHGSFLCLSDSDLSNSVSQDSSSFGTKTSFTKLTADTGSEVDHLGRNLLDIAKKLHVLEKKTDAIIKLGDPASRIRDVLGDVKTEITTWAKGVKSIKDDILHHLANILTNVEAEDSIDTNGVLDQAKLQKLEAKAGITSD
jgi:hypothetical protein